MIMRLHRQSAFALPALLLLLAGCGVGQYDSASTQGAFSIAASSSAINSNHQIQFSALASSGDAVPVVWSVAGGDNASSLGEGHISATGLYTPPAALSQDMVRIQIAAQLKSDPLQTTSQVVSITPGFVQSLLPENAALTAGATLTATAEIAEINAGTVNWSITGSGNDPGTLSNASCRHSLDQYTTCKISYTAPSSQAQSTVYLNATVDESSTTAPLQILLNDGVNSSPVTNQAAQTGAIALGSSGSNDNDFDTYLGANGESYVADCCGGTLGALVEDGEDHQYILSNNHVLAESDQGKAGDIIDEPGMIDDGCVPLSHAGSTLREVGTLKYFVPLDTTQTDVDAALASVAPGAVDPTGSILQLAAPVQPVEASDMLGAAPPMGGDGEVLSAANLNGLELAKSGRTTGLTCSTVTAVDMSVKVDYFKDCAETQPYYTKIFTNQIGIAGDKFSDSGDSGSLVVDASNAEPVGLFFAGGTDGNGNGLSVANPIGEVLRELGAQAGANLSIVGTATPHSVACIRYDTTSTAAVVPLSTGVKTRAKEVAETAGAYLVNPETGILGVSGGGSLDQPGTPALIVYVDRTNPAVNVPLTVDGVRTQVIATNSAALARDAAPARPAVTSGIVLTAQALAGAETVVRQYAPQLLKDPSIFGVGVTQSLDNPADPALLVLVDPKIAPRATPATIGGMRVRYMTLNRFHVTRSKYAGVNAAPSCALKKMVAAGHSDRGRLRP
jgi:hypothetical protein